MKVGILGGGQLARMLILASPHLECEVRVYAPPGENSVEGLCPITRKKFDDSEGLREFISSCDRVTYEWENISIPELRAALEGVSERLFPSLKVLELVSNRYTQKKIFTTHGIPTAEFSFIQQASELEPSVLKIGVPGILKTCREGYDGKGQKVIRKPEELSSAWSELGGVPLIYEKFIKFERELSLVACRNARGEMRFYPLVENLHVNGILRRTLAPAPGLSTQLQQTAQGYAKKIGELLQYVGVMALELFETGGKLLINEMASRVHNTGHWTLDGAETSQFENHLRAGLEVPLGDTAPKGYTAMLNFIGEVPTLAVEELKREGVFVHLYGKKPRLNRKVGHLNITADSPEALFKKLKVLEPKIIDQALQLLPSREEGF
ncbi:MAG: 5-(carboxyamino)imidazole ribonucleotide synthase [Proteobacteria bacterium]|nr:5-(carboxyamino)imidazole ribonucleotide synthase [Pseudomonadota bacterium]